MFVSKRYPWCKTRLPKALLLAFPWFSDDTKWHLKVSKEETAACLWERSDFPFPVHTGQ